MQVDNACRLADDDYFRPGMSKKMKVQLAKFEMHNLLDGDVAHHKQEL